MNLKEKEIDPGIRGNFFVGRIAIESSGSLMIGKLPTDKQIQNSALLT